MFLCRVTSFPPSLFNVQPGSRANKILIRYQSKYGMSGLLHSTCVDFMLQQRPKLPMCTHIPTKTTPFQPMRSMRHMQPMQLIHMQCPTQLVCSPNTPQGQLWLLCSLQLLCLPFLLKGVGCKGQQAQAELDYLMLAAPAARALGVQ